MACNKKISYLSTSKKRHSKCLFFPTILSSLSLSSSPKNFLLTTRNTSTYFSLSQDLLKSFKNSALTVFSVCESSFHSEFPKKSRIFRQILQLLSKISFLSIIPSLSLTLSSSFSSQVSLHHGSFMYVESVILNYLPKPPLLQKILSILPSTLESFFKRIQHLAKPFSNDRLSSLIEHIKLS